MNYFYSILCVSILLIGCKTETDNTVKETYESETSTNETIANKTFKNNSATVLANIKGWQNENIDYAMYADDFITFDTGFGAKKDTITLNEMIENDKYFWASYDFKLLTDPPVLLPGVNADTKMLDGSVRHYSDWEVTLTATDSTEAKTGVIHIYESFDFNKEGKISNQVVYGDFTGIMMYLNSKE